MIASKVIRFINHWKYIDIPREAKDEILELGNRQCLIERRLLMMDYPSDPLVFAIFTLQDEHKAK